MSWSDVIWDKKLCHVISTLSKANGKESILPSFRTNVRNPHFFCPPSLEGGGWKPGDFYRFLVAMRYKGEKSTSFSSPSSERGSCSLGGAPRFIGVKGYVAPPHFGSPSPMGRNIYSTYLILSEKTNKTNLQKKSLKFVLTFYIKSIYSKYTNSTSSWTVWARRIASWP